MNFLISNFYSPIGLLITSICAILFGTLIYWISCIPVKKQITINQRVRTANRCQQCSHYRIDYEINRWGPPEQKEYYVLSIMPKMPRAGIGIQTSLATC